MKPTDWTQLSAACAAALCFGGCASSHVDKHFGEAFQLNGAAMIANPEAPSEVVPTGLDPETGARVAERYYRGQQVQPQRPTTTVIIGED